MKKNIFYKSVTFFIALSFLLFCETCFAQGTANNNVTTSKNNIVVQPSPCPNLEKLDNICLNVSNRMRDPKPQGEYGYLHHRKIFEAACVELDKDSEEVIAKKIQIMWDAAHAKRILKCDSAQFDVSGGNILKFAVAKTFWEFIDDAIWWKVNLNYIDDIDKRTVLDYVRDQIERSKGRSTESTLQFYYKNLREAGAKHAAELK